jgi:ATP-dependent RNA helicase RhlE
MNEITLPSGETVYYEYNPRSDALDIQLKPATNPTDLEPMPGSPHVQLRRDRVSGAVVALAVHGVQALLLEHLVRDLVAHAGDDPGHAAADEPSPVSPDRPVPAGRREPPLAPATEPSPPAPTTWPVEPGGVPSEPAPLPIRAIGTLPLVYDDSDEVGDDLAATADPERKRRRRRRRKGGGGQAPESVAEDASPVAEADSPTAVDEPEPIAAAAAIAVAAAPAAFPAEAPAPMPELVSDELPAPVVAPSYPWPPILLLGETREPLSAPVLQPVPAPEPTFAPFLSPSPPPAPDVPEPPPAAPAVPIERSQPQALAAGDQATPEGFAYLDLDPRLGTALAAMGYLEPTPIQRRALPIARTGRDMMGLAQTGTGKTMAFLLPSLERMLADTDTRHRPRLLVITPTRELAVQVSEQAVMLAQNTGFRVAVIYGGAPMGPQIQALHAGADIIVATPGRLLDHVSHRHVHLDTVQVLVLDESDRMLDMGFLPEVRRILSLLPHERQTLLFGATLPPDIEGLSRKFQRDPEIVEVARQLPPETLDQRLYPVGRHLKLPLLLYLLKNEPALSKVLVFTETKVETDIVARKLEESGLKVASMHGDRPQKDRERALSDLKDGTVQALVATNVAARGLDIEDVTHVINYDMPQSVDEYIHRIGRTARGAAAEGTAYTFVTLADEGMVLRIESALERSLPRVQATGLDYDVPTPSWAQPSAQDISRALTPPSLSNLSRSFRGGVGRKRR